jgi:hypothetical protein
VFPSHVVCCFIRDASKSADTPAAAGTPSPAGAPAKAGTAAATAGSISIEITAQSERTHATAVMLSTAVAPA